MQGTAAAFVVYSAFRPKAQTYAISPVVDLTMVTPTGISKRDDVERCKTRPTPAANCQSARAEAIVCERPDAARAPSMKEEAADLGWHGHARAG